MKFEYFLNPTINVWALIIAFVIANWVLGSQNLTPAIFALLVLKGLHLLWDVLVLLEEYYTNYKNTKESK